MGVFRHSRYPEEDRLTLLLLGEPEEPSHREAYRTFLASRGDVRAELFHCEAALSTDGLPAEERARLRARFSQLLESKESSDFWALVGRTAALRNCGGGGPLGKVRFSFQCPKRWEGLEPTANPDVRSCSRCEETVRLCRTREEAESEARRGGCIAVSWALTEKVRSSLSRYVTGRPDPVKLWADALFPDDPSSD
jgi:hypothetical protein